MRCLICGSENEAILCRSCESEENIKIILSQLLDYKNCESDNELLKDYVLSFNSRGEAADEVLNICSQYLKPGFELTYYIARSYEYKGKCFRPQFIKYALKYMDNPTEDKSKTAYLLYNLSKTYAAEYEFYKAIEICDMLLGPDYEFINANLQKADCLLKLRKIDKAIELLESVHGDLKGRWERNEFNNEEEKNRNERSLGLYESRIAEYSKKCSEGYIYVPATRIGKEKLDAILKGEGRYVETKALMKQTEADFDTFVCFDFETTGFTPKDKITEIGAVKVINGEIAEYFSELVNPKRYISKRITEITGITKEMVQDKETINTILPRFLKFAGDNVLVAHNADFDCGFLLREASELGYEIKNPVLDTLALSRRKLPGIPSHKLTYLTEHFRIRQEDAHRAYCDAEATAKLYLKLKEL